MKGLATSPSTFGVQGSGLEVMAVASGSPVGAELVEVAGCGSGVRISPGRVAARMSSGLVGTGWPPEKRSNRLARAATPGCGGTQPQPLEDRISDDPGRRFPA